MSPSGQSEVGVLKRVVLKHVRDAFVDESVIDAEWEALGYLHRLTLPWLLGSTMRS